MEVSGVDATKRRLAERAGLIALERNDLRAGVERDIRQSRDAIDEITRHRRFKPFAAHDEMNVFDLGRQEHHRLPGGVAATDQRDLLAFAQFRFDRRRPIGHAGALEAQEVRDVRLAIARA